jgi:hypothetical protein
MLIGKSSFPNFPIGFVAVLLNQLVNKYYIDEDVKEEIHIANNIDKN